MALKGDVMADNRLEPNPGEPALVGEDVWKTVPVFLIESEKAVLEVLITA